MRSSAIPRSRGTTLVETMVSVAVFGFIISFVAYLMFMAGINSYNVHDQVLAQNAAGMAMERSVTLLRNASQFSLWPGDAAGDDETTYTRIRFAVPPVGTSGGSSGGAVGTAQTTSVLCYHAGRNEVQYYLRESDVTFNGGEPRGIPTLRYPNISEFYVHFESDYRLKLSMGYEYRGFAMVFNRPERPMLGTCVTDVVAKNHHVGYKGNGAYDDNYENNTSSPVHL